MTRRKRGTNFRQGVLGGQRAGLFRRRLTGIAWSVQFLRALGRRRDASLWACWALFGMTGACGPRADDITTVQPGFVRKAIFQSDSEWYYRRTIVKSETTNAYIVEGQGDIMLDRVRFRIEEKVLVAYKPYASIAGSEDDVAEGNDSFEGAVVASWPILSHFDRIRNYNAPTGNETNSIQENTLDRAWHERTFMRVDWAANQIAGSLFADRSGSGFPVNYVSSFARWSDLQTTPTDPYASRFSDDYVEVTHHAILSMDLITCAAFVGFFRAGYSQCGFGEAKVRHSFKRIAQVSDYEPRIYPDSVVRTNESGKPIYDDQTGEVLREPIYDRFGIFRVSTPTYDRGYETTESGRLFRANLFDIWERSTDEQGRSLPFSERTPRPIVYYLNAEYPEQYRAAASEVADEYNRIFSSLVKDLTERSTDNVPRMFEIRPNDCRVDNIVAFVEAHPDMLGAVRRAVCRDKPDCVSGVEDVAERLAVGNLRTVCTSLEAATLDLETGQSRFEWQRVGDVRYNMVVWLQNPQQSGWGGYGPMHGDARTGETVSASAFIRGFAQEVSAANIVDYIELINDEKSPEEIIHGQDIRKQVARSVKRQQSLSETEVSPHYLARMERRFRRLGASKDSLLRELPSPDQQLSRLDRIRGTRAEAPLITNEWLMMAAQGAWRPGEPVPDGLQDLASPAGRFRQQDHLSQALADARARLGDSGFCFLKQDFDPHWVGLALAFKEKPNGEPYTRDERYEIVINRLVKHVMLHEIGHNVGLTHNFEGSYDAMNYDDRFWDLFFKGQDEQLAGRIDEFRHTTVMEYLAAKGAFADFLGKYDEAAIRFAYAGQVAVFEADAAGSELEGGQDLRAWRYRNDYREIPEHLCGASGCAARCAPGDTICAGQVAKDAIRKRTWVTFDPQNPPKREVPFLFCDNYYDRRTPFCSTFDYGSNLREVFANYHSMWSNYFFFNNFVRDRLVPISWNPSRATIPANFAMSYIDTVAQWLYYYRVTEPGFEATNLYRDMHATVAMGLNMASEILSTPEPDRMCPVPNVGGETEGEYQPKIYVPWFLIDDDELDCDPDLSLAGEEARALEAIQVPLGQSRPAGVGFTEDYEDWSWSFVGSFFDKSNTILRLGITRPTLFRFNYDLDLRNYSIGLYRLFEPELRDLYDRIATIDSGTDLSIRSQETAMALGSYWCRDPEHPDDASRGYFEPRALIDPERNESLPGPPPDCDRPSYVYPRFFASIPFTGMLAAHALFSSDLDTQLDMGKSYKVFALGAYDDFVDWASLPECDDGGSNVPCFCRTLDSFSRIEYRSINIVAEKSSPGCSLVAGAEAARFRYEDEGQSPADRDTWRQWVERLEYARLLYQIFQNE